MTIYDSKTFNRIKEIESVKLGEESYFYAYDDWLYRFVYSEYKSVSPYNPVSTQTTFYSDISHDFYPNMLPSLVPVFILFKQ